MLEKDIENLIARYPDEFFPNSGFKLVGQQVDLGGYRADLIFNDKHNRKIIVEVKRGLLTRDASGQIMEYYGLLKQKNSKQVIELVLCANIIPHERRFFLENAGIECKELDISLILGIAQKYNYKFINDNSDDPKEICQQQQNPSLIKGNLELEEGGSNIWIFQGNPEKWPIIEDLANKDLKDWGIRQNKKIIKKGDTALIWISGKSAGIYAVAEIISNPEYMPCTPEEELKWKDKKQAKGRDGVYLKFTKYFLDNPIYRYELRNTPGLEHLSIFGFKNATNYLVRKEEWEIIKQKIKCR